MERVVLRLALGGSRPACSRFQRQRVGVRDRTIGPGRPLVDRVNAPASAQLRLLVGAVDAPAVVAVSEPPDHPQLKHGERERPYENEPDCEVHQRPAPKYEPATCRCERADERQRRRGET